MSRATKVVAFAARLLPKELRDRYREQWLADLRDADEAGIDPAEVVWGSLAFVATVNSPILPGLRRPDAAGRTRRARLAGALALSTAVLGLSQFGHVFVGGVTGDTVRDFAVFLTIGLMELYFALATIGAVSIVVITRHIGTRVRTAVGMLVLASCAPLVQLGIDGLAGYGVNSQLGYLAYQYSVYVLAAVLVAVALRLLWVEVADTGRPRRASIPALAVAAGAVLAAGVLGVVPAVFVWLSRTSPVFNWESGGYVGTTGPDGTFVLEEIEATRAMYDEWVWLNEMAEQQVAWGFALLAASVVLLVVAVVVLSVRARMSSGPLAVAAIGLVMLLSAAMTSFLQLMPLAPVLPPELLQIIGQLLLVGVILYAIGGVRFDSKRLARPSHRHDVEGGVELVES